MGKGETLHQKTVPLIPPMKGRERIMINGAIENIRLSLLDEMEAIYDIPTDADEFASRELMEALAKYTGILQREIAVYIDRTGGVLDVSIGDSNTVSLINLRLRRSGRTLAGIRCLHTHPNGDPALSLVDLNSLKTLRLDAMASLSVKDGRPSAVQCAWLCPNGDDMGVTVSDVYGIYRIPQNDWYQTILDVDAQIDAFSTTSNEEEGESAILFGRDDPESETMRELKALADTAGVRTVYIDCQKRRTTEPGTYIGSGKAQELSLIAQSLSAQVIIFNDELTGVQIKNLTQLTGCKIIDRTMLILDIFAGRAQSREGKLQVELAQLKYNSTRLIGMGVAMSRLGGGIGTRGPGETKLEMDRRRIRMRINEIEREIAAVAKNRAVRRQKRERNAAPVAALVGYTNAGKSTLLNAISGSDVYVQDQLFATLDTTTRRISLPDGSECLLVDTVGFISRLPHTLVDAFKSTLEEALYADLLVVVADASSPHMREQQQVVDEVLTQLGAGDKPRIYAYNKCDKSPALMDIVEKPCVAVSGKHRLNLDRLLLLIQDELRGGMIDDTLLIPYAKSNVSAFIHKYGTVKAEEYKDSGTLITFTIDPVSHARVKKMLE